MRNVLVALGPANAIALLDTLEGAQQDGSHQAASRSAAIIAAAKTATSDSYVSGALGKLAICIPGTTTTVPAAGAAD